MKHQDLWNAYQASLANAIETGVPVKLTLCKPGDARGCNEFARGAMQAKGGPLNRGIRPSGFGTNVARWCRPVGRWGR
jgi:hypothetical protein